MSMANQAATHMHVKDMNKMISQIKQNEVYLRYSKLPGKEWYITVFSDASLKGLPGKVHSAMGYIIMLSNGYNPGSRSKCCVLQWKAVKVSRVSTSTYEAETLALLAALEDAIMLKLKLTQITGFPENLIKIEAFCDCNDTVEAIRSTKQNNKSVLVQADIAKIKQLVERKQVNTINWIPTQHQLADCLTKRGAATTAIKQTVVKGKFFA